MSNSWAFPLRLKVSSKDQIGRTVSQNWLGLMEMSISGGKTDYYFIMGLSAV